MVSGHGLFRHCQAVDKIFRKGVAKRCDVLKHSTQQTMVLELLLGTVHVNTLTAILVS